MCFQALKALQQGFVPTPRTSHSDAASGLRSGSSTTHFGLAEHNPRAGTWSASHNLLIIMVCVLLKHFPNIPMATRGARA